MHMKQTVDGHLDTTPPFCVVKKECLQPRIQEDLQFTEQLRLPAVADLEI